MSNKLSDVEIVWKPSEFLGRATTAAGADYGMVGGVRAFTIVNRGHCFTLHTHLPTPVGSNRRETPFTKLEKAQNHAEHLLEAFIRDFFAPPPEGK